MWEQPPCHILSRTSTTLYAIITNVFNTVCYEHPPAVCDKLLRVDMHRWICPLIDSLDVTDDLVSDQSYQTSIRQESFALQWRQMCAMASQINGNSAVCLGWYQRKYYTLQALCRGNPPVNSGSPHKRTVMWKAFPCRDVLMYIISMA